MQLFVNYIFIYTNSRCHWSYNFFEYLMCLNKQKTIIQCAYLKNIITLQTENNFIYKLSWKTCTRFMYKIFWRYDLQKKFFNLVEFWWSCGAIFLWEYLLYFRCTVKKNHVIDCNKKYIFFMVLQRRTYAEYYFLYSFDVVATPYKRFNSFRSIDYYNNRNHIDKSFIHILEISCVHNFVGRHNQRDAVTSLYR